MNADIDAPAGRFIGQRIARREDPRLLTGRGTYVDDITMPELLHAAFVRSPYAAANITSIDTDAAAALPGVVAVITATDLDVVRDTNAKINLGFGDSPMPSPLATDRVGYVGDPIAIVVADDRATAEDACELVEVDFEPLKPRLGIEPSDDEETATIPEALARRLSPNVLPTTRSGEIFGSAAHVVEERISQHRYLAVPMETRGIVGSWDPHSAMLTVWTTTQGPHRVRDHLARALGIAENRVRVIVGDVGGGFGLKLMVSRDETAVALAARVVGQPVKWIEDRWENLVAAPHARQEYADVSVALASDAKLLAIHVDHRVDVGHDGDPNLGMARLVAGPYRVGAVTGATTSIRTNTAPRGAYRGPWMFETVARETMIDIAARRIGVDPLEIRRRNVIQQSDLPFASNMGPYNDVTPAETLEQAATMLDYDAFRSWQRDERERGRYVGVGIALFMEHTALAVGTGATDAVTLRVDPSGSVQLITGVNSQGHSVETTMAQVVADHLGIDIDDITFVNGDTATVPLGASTGGSRNAVYGGGAARQAALEMRRLISRLAAHLFEAAPDDIIVENGSASVRGTPSTTIALGELATIAYLEPRRLPQDVGPGLEVATRFHGGQGFTWSNAAHMCTCEVDTETGVVNLLRYIVSEDCGTMINPMVVEGQIAGGVVQGIGGALLENFVYDEDGNPLTSSFMDYLLPTTTDVPTIEFGHIETPSSRPGGFKGMGEGGAIGAPAAVINAVADALSPFDVTLSSQPLTPPRLLAAIQAGRD